MLAENKGLSERIQERIDKFVARDNLKGFKDFCDQQKLTMAHLQLYRSNEASKKGPLMNSAAKICAYDIFIYLIENGFPLNSIDLSNLRNALHDAAAIYAWSSGSTEAAAFIGPLSFQGQLSYVRRTILKIAKVLLERGIDKYKLDTSGDNALEILTSKVDYYDLDRVYPNRDYTHSEIDGYTFGLLNIEDMLALFLKHGFVFKDGFLDPTIEINKKDANIIHFKLNKAIVILYTDVYKAMTSLFDEVIDFVDPNSLS